MSQHSSQLMEIQRRMAAAVMHPLTCAETMPRRRRDGTSNNSEAEAIIRPNDRLTSFERLEIYNRQYWFRLYTCFEEDFPGLEGILGRAKFDRLMRNYLTDCPSESFTLRNLGSRLEEWLLNHPNFAAPHEALALDMVRLEWAHIEVFDAAEYPRLKPKQLAGIDEGTVLQIQPSLRLLTLKYPVDDLLLAVQNENGSSDSSVNSANSSRKRNHVRRVAALAPKSIWLAVHRQENTVWYKPLQAEAFRLLSSIAAGEPLGTAIEGAFSDSAISEDQRPEFIQERFADWAMLGWFRVPANF